MGKKYHKYVFDAAERKFVGEFEKMYQAESMEGFDSWQQEDTRKIWLRICHLILSYRNFRQIVDVGCGKGTFTHLLKKANNEVTAIDLSPTALKRAEERYPDIKWVCADITSAGFQWDRLFARRPGDLV